MTELLVTEIPASMIAAATTVHLAVLLLRYHRNPDGRRYDLLLLPAAAFAATPWLFPTVAGVAAGLTAQLTWFVSCDRVVPAASTPAPAPSAAPAAPSPRSSAGRSPAPRVPATRATGTGFARAVVVAVFDETPDIKTFRIARPEDTPFRAGQFLTVRVTVNGRATTRCYSVSSAPEAAGYYEISVKRQGVVSGMLHATVRPGSQIEVMPPAGPFVYPSDDQRPITLLAGGVGITPLMSMLRHAVMAEPTRPVTLLYSVQTHRDIAFRDEMEWLVRRNSQVKIVVTASRGPHGTEVRSGRIDRRLLEEEVADLEQNLFMVCGPQPMIDAMRSILAEIGVPPEQVRSEAFEAAIASAGGTTADIPPSSTATVFRLELARSRRTLEVTGGQTLLEACEAAGVALPSACRMGVCGTCRCRLVSGRVAGGEEGMLSDADRAQGYVLPCIASPADDCVMEA